jgi:hypothetical protein
LHEAAQNGLRFEGRTLSTLEWITLGGPGLVFLTEGAFVELGGKEISLALIGKAHPVSMISQSLVVIFKNSRLNATLIQPIPQVRHQSTRPTSEDFTMLMPSDDYQPGSLLRSFHQNADSVSVTARLRVYLILDFSCGKNIGDSVPR